MVTIDGLEDNAICMEQGGDDTLRAPLALAEALPQPRQIAEAGKAVRDKGAIHRDLKPGYFKVPPEVVVKVPEVLVKLMDEWCCGVSPHENPNPCNVLHRTRTPRALGTWRPPPQTNASPFALACGYAAFLYRRFSGKVDKPVAT